MRRVLMALTFAGAGVLATGFLSQPAHADPYRWCAEYGNFSSGGTNCYFMTLAQCRAAISGNGGFCRRNTFYTGSRGKRGRDSYGMSGRSYHR